MKKNTKIVRLTENDLERMVKKIIKEDSDKEADLINDTYELLTDMGYEYVEDLYIQDLYEAAEVLEDELYDGDHGPNMNKEIEDLLTNIYEIIGYPDEAKDESEDYMDEDGEFDDEEDLVPIGVDNLESQGTSGLVLLFSPLESDMVKDWNNDKQIQRFVEEERLFLNELSYDKWEIYGIEGDRQVRNYIMKNYSW